MSIKSNSVATVRDAQGRTLYGIASARVGKRRAISALAFVTQWDIALDALGVEDITLQEFADWWGESRSTVFRSQSLFREAFPPYSTPTPVLRIAWAVAAARQAESEPVAVFATA